MTKVFAGYDSSKMILGEIIVRGVRARVTSALLNNVEFPFEFANKVNVQTNDKVLYICTLLIIHLYILMSLIT